MIWHYEVHFVIMQVFQAFYLYIIMYVEKCPRKVSKTKTVHKWLVVSG